MNEYIMQILFLMATLLIYVINGSIVYYKVGEPYKETPLRSFAVGAATWVLLCFLSIFFYSGINIKILWFIYSLATLSMLLFIPKNRFQEFLPKVFFRQLLASFFVLVPVLFFIVNDETSLWQEFAIYANSFFVMADSGTVTGSVTQYPIAYQLVLLPVTFFSKVNENIFAAFNLFLMAFIACEFVRNCGVKIRKGNIAFPLMIAFFVLVFLNPFSNVKYLLSGHTFIFSCVISLGVAEILFRTGHLPKNIACIPVALMLMLLSLSSPEGGLLAFSLLLVLSLRYLVQIKNINYNQAIGFFILPCMLIFIFSFWRYFLASKGIDFVPFDGDRINFENYVIVYKALFILAKEYKIEAFYLLSVLLAGAFSFKKVIKTEDIVVDKYLLRTVFWIMIIYMGVCLPLYFSQFDYVARASYSLGFSSIALLQFIVLMPIGRCVKEIMSELDINLSKSFKFTFIVGLLLVFFMKKQNFQETLDDRIINMKMISQYINDNIDEKSKIAIVDMHRMVKLYKNILEFRYDKHDFVDLPVEKFPKGISDAHKYLRSNEFSYILLHGPNNVFAKVFEYNLDPNFTYLYKVEDEKFSLVHKFENKFYKDTNMKL